MEKTIEQIKEEVAKDHGWNNYNSALDAINAGVMSGFSFSDLWEDVTTRYAQQFQTPTDPLNTEIMVLRERVEELEGCLREVTAQLELKQGFESSLSLEAKLLINKSK